MGLLRRLFTGGRENNQEFIPTTFIECLDIVHNWSARAAIDPDFDINDKKLHAALKAQVTCPYCANSIQFGNAVKFQGISLQVQCPICHTIPSKEKDYDQELA
jgi:hypothetical protein